MSESQEKDFLRYQGNAVPRVIRLAWTLFIAFCIFYSVNYAWGDLKQWLKAIS